MGYNVHLNLFLELSKVLELRLVHTENVFVIWIALVANLKIEIKARHIERKWIFEHISYPPLLRKYLFR